MKTVLSIERSKCKHGSGSISTDTDLQKNLVKLINKSLENNGLRILQYSTNLRSKRSSDQHGCAAHRVASNQQNEINVQTRFCLHLFNKILHKRILVYNEKAQGSFISHVSIPLGRWKFSNYFCLEQPINSNVTSQYKNSYS